MINFSRRFLVLALCLPLLAQAGKPSKLIANLEAGKKQVVVAYGTSLTEGGAWVKQIQEALNKQYPGLATVINSGGSGQWSKWGVENLEKRVITKKPDTVFIEFAINDSVERFKGSPGIARANLETMITRILDSNPQCEIILMTMTPGNKYQPGHRSYRKDIEGYYEMYRSVAKEKELLLVDHYSNWKKLQAENNDFFLKYVPDTIHPTATGCRQIVTPVILEALGISGIRKSSAGSPDRTMPWEDPNYAKDDPATIPDSRAKERAKGGWTAFIKHHENRKRWVTEKKVDILFIGDSITFQWGRRGREVWKEHYENRNAVNIGSSGDRSSHMLWHIQDGGLDGMKDRNPKVVVIMAGTNNRGKPELKGADTANGVLAILKEVHHRLPNSKILLLAIFPRGWEPDDKGRIRNNQINAILKTYADNKTVYWLDLKDVFLDKDGKLRKDLMPDSLHPSVEGYQVWAKAMEPMLSQLLKQ